MDDFLPKPIQAADLWAATERITGSRPPADRPRPGLLDPRVLLAACEGDAATLEEICQVLRARLPDHLTAVQERCGSRTQYGCARPLTSFVARWRRFPPSSVPWRRTSKIRRPVASSKRLGLWWNSSKRSRGSSFEQVDGVSIEALREQAAGRQRRRPCSQHLDSSPATDHFAPYGSPKCSSVRRIVLRCFSRNRRPSEPWAPAQPEFVRDSRALRRRDFESAASVTMRDMVRAPIIVTAATMAFFFPSDG